VVTVPLIASDHLHPRRPGSKACDQQSQQYLECVPERRHRAWECSSYGDQFGWSTRGATDLFKLPTVPKAIEPTMSEAGSHRLLVGERDGQVFELGQRHRGMSTQTLSTCKGSPRGCAALQTSTSRRQPLECHEVPIYRFATTEREIADDACDVFLG
jgi:hypothetical protein